MGFVQRRDGRDERGMQTSDAVQDLEPLACPVCRQDLHPWQATCPDDGAAAVQRTALPPRQPAPPAHLLDDGD